MSPAGEQTGRCSEQWHQTSPRPRQAVSVAELIRQLWLYMIVWLFDLFDLFDCLIVWSVWLRQSWWYFVVRLSRDLSQIFMPWLLPSQGHWFRANLLLMPKKWSFGFDSPHCAITGPRLSQVDVAIRLWLCLLHYVTHWFSTSPGITSWKFFEQHLLNILLNRLPHHSCLVHPVLPADAHDRRVEAEHRSEVAGDGLGFESKTARTMSENVGWGRISALEWQ